MQWRLIIIYILHDYRVGYWVRANHDFFLERNTMKLVVIFGLLGIILAAAGFSYIYFVRHRVKDEKVGAHRHPDNVRRKGYEESSTTQGWQT
jgi:hypothetical protein